MQAGRLSQLLSQSDACSVLRHAFIGIYDFCKRAEADLAQPDVNAYKELDKDLRGEHPIGLAAFGYRRPSCQPFAIHCSGVPRLTQLISGKARQMQTICS